MAGVLRASVVPGALVGMLTLAGVVVGRIFADDLVVWLTAGSAAGSVAVGVAARRLPAWSAAPLSALVLTGYVTVALRVAAGGQWPDWTAVAGGIPRLLTALIPVEAAPETVVVPVVAVWVAGLAAVEVAVRSRRVLLGLSPVLGVYAGALYVVGPNAETPVLVSTGFAALAALALAVSALTRSSSFPVGRITTARFTTGKDEEDPAELRVRAMLRMRALGGAAAGLVALLGLVAVIGPWASRQVSVMPQDPRQYVEPPRVDSLDESPLNRISGWALAPKESLLEYRPSETGAAPETRLRLAVLSDYDGVTWKVGGLYRNAGRVLPVPSLGEGTSGDVAFGGDATSESRQEITVTGLSGRLLPVVPTPTAISGARVAYDAATGTLIRPEGLTEGLRYATTTLEREPDLNALPIAEVPSGDAVARYLTVATGVPERIQRLAEQLAEGNGAAYDRAVAIEEFLADHYRQVADAPSGHAYPNIDHFLFGRKELGGRRGTSEQFAAAYALMARLSGLPSRIVVGFRAPAAGGVVTAGDAVAWPEVLFDGLGWVAFDPMPKSDEPTPVEDDFRPQPTTPPATPSASPEPSPSGSASAAPPVVAAAPSGDAVSGTVVAGAASGSLVVMVLLGGLVVIAMRRAQTRRRLTVGGPDERVTGAWLEFTDILRLAGSPLPSHLSATEAGRFAAAVAEHTATPFSERPGAVNSGQTDAAFSRQASFGQAVAGTVGGTPVDGLIEAVNTVGFAPGEADERQADRAGVEVRAYAAALRGQMPWWRRLWWSVRPGPLRWRGGRGG
ncbi:transglutaminaseTgpA domain-containing protein [Actinoplanes sp. NBRC 101535]|uniref:DUF3488 and transglutaminase-like domain-containing protein n=1 Tax=Actinoplanes sp. NBRC 101535 TaxID=3032196 RepID=UPI003337D74C